MALLGYAIGLPGLTADVLLVTCFYAMKDARTPLFTNIVTVGARIVLLLLLFKLLTGQYAILAIPLAASVVGTAEAVVLSFILFMRLRKKIKTDKGVQRLKQRRLHVTMLKDQVVTSMVNGPGAQMFAFHRKNHDQSLRATFNPP